MPIQDTAIAAVTGRIVSAHDADASVELAGDDLIELLAAFGDRSGVTSDAMAKKLRDPSMTVADKVAELKKGVSAKERQDIEAILDEGTVPLAPESRAILEAVLDRPVTGFSSIDDAWGAMPHDVSGRADDRQPAPSAGSALADGSVLSLQIAALSSKKPGVDKVSEKIAGEMIDRVKELKDVGGTGVEQWGQGDPDLIERRALFSQLMDQEAVVLDFVEEAWAKSDKKFLEAIERVDEITGSDYSYSPLTSNVTSAKSANNAKATKAADALKDGSARFYEADPQTFSTVVVNKLDDAELRARTLVDLMLQFREPEDTTGKLDKKYGGGTGVAAVLELRGMAATADPTRGDVAIERDYALKRATALANPRNSSNAVLEARHLVSNIRRMSWSLVYGKGAVADGFEISPYSAIHHNFSTNSPKIIRSFVGDTVFGGGDPESFAALVDIMNAARDTPASRADALMARLGKKDSAIVGEFEKFAKKAANKDKPLGDQLEAFLVSRCKGKLDSPGIDDPTLTSDEKSHLRQGNVESVKGEYGKKLTLIARLYRAVCNTMPSAQTFHDHYFTAYGAKPQLADVIYALESDAPPVSTLQAIVAARTAIRDEIGKHDKGYERMNLWELDQKLELMSSSYLGGLVESVGSLETPEQHNDAMGAMKVALEGALLSGLDQIRDTSDPISSIGPSLSDALAELNELFAAGQVSVDEYRTGIARAYEAIVKTTENIRAFIDSRVPDVSLGRLIPNPGFMDDFIKEGPLHYARAIAQKAMTVGLEQELSAKRVVNPDGVSMLNNLGKVVFDRIVVADNMAQLRELNAGRNDFCIVKTLDEKKMIAVGGVMAPFPGGYCHAAVYARGAGMAALSNPKIGKVWQAFARNLGDDKLYYDDSGGQIVMLPFKEAIKEGLVKEADADKLHPGSNREVDFLSWDDAEKMWKTIGHHTVTVHPDRPTRHIEIFIPSGEVNGLGSHVLTGEEAGALGINGRGLGGEKNTVLAMMAVHPVLKKWVVPNSYISTLQCYQLLDDAGVLKAWRDVFDKDSVVTKITDDNFMQSRLYTDAEYRTGVRERMSAMVHEKVMKHFVGDDGKPTDAGKALLEEMRRNPDLSGNTPLIIRSSFSAEDRPFKSGAGQYDSFPNRKTDVEILEAVMGVIASYWEEPPIENNVTEEYNLEHIAPSVGINKSLHAKYSGVMFSRARDGKRRTAAYQVVKGFGGGVEEGKTEMGELTKDGNKLEHTIPGMDKSIIDPGIEKELWEMAMEVEKFFHEQVEEGKGFAVDMEWVFDEDDQKLYIVQARTVRA